MTTFTHDVTQHDKLTNSQVNIILQVHISTRTLELEAIKGVIEKEILMNEHAMLEFTGKVPNWN